MSIKQFYKRVPWWELLGILVLLWPALLNGFPILNNDAGTNITSGELFETPVDRPIGYGILLRLFSLNSFSICIATIVQVALVNTLFFKTCRQVATAASEAKIFALLAVLCATTSLPWVATLIIPDVYTALSFLLVFLILVQPRPSVWLYVLFFVCTATHGSQVQIMTGLLIALTLLRPLLFKDGLSKKMFWGRAGILALLAGLTVLTMISTISKSKHVFFISSMANRGILVPFLEKSCPTENFELCTSKELLRGKNGDWFLWFPESPLNQKGRSWLSFKEDYNNIISASFKDKEYRVIQVKTILEQGMRQLWDYRFINYDQPFGENDNVWVVLRTFYGSEANLMMNARQQTGRLKPIGDFFNNIQSAVVPLSVLLLLIAAFVPALRHNRRIWAFTVAAVILILGNDLVCAGLSGVNSRYGARVIWLLPMAAGLAILGGRTQPLPAGTEPDEKS